MDLSAHLVSTMIFTALIYRATNNFTYAGIFILGGILIDLDHFIDYFIYYKNRFKLDDFLCIRFLRSGKTYVFFHSWELVIIILITALAGEFHGWFIFSLSLAQHLFIDNVQKKNPWFYFLIYRLFKRFNVEALLPEYNLIFEEKG